MYNNNEITNASDHISNILSRGEDARGDADEELRKVRDKIDLLQDVVSKADDAMRILKELNEKVQEIQNEYEDVQLDN